MAERSESEKCPTCGTTRITFDPPLEITVVDGCESTVFLTIVVDGIILLARNIKCMDILNHDGKHSHLVDEEVVTWPSTR